MNLNFSVPCSVQCRTIELVLIMEKMLLRIPEQMSSSLCWRRCRWMWCKTTGSKILRDSEEREKENKRSKQSEDDTEKNYMLTFIEINLLKIHI